MGAPDPLPLKSSKMPELPPYRPGDPRWNERDRFGLPVWISLLSESAEDRAAREAVAADLLSTAVKHLGQSETQNRVADLGRDARRTRKAKLPNRERDRLFLEMYDRMVLEAPKMARSVPRLLAIQLYN